MKVFNCILGGFSIIGAIYCMFYPGLTFLSGGWIVTILLGVLGICSIFEFATNKDKKENKGLVADGVIGLIMGIGAAVVSILGIFNVWVRGYLDLMILMIFAFWMCYSGVTGIFKAVDAKKKGISKWVFSLILGILVTLCGIYSATHPVFSAITIGYVTGFALMFYGVRLIASVFEEK